MTSRWTSIALAAALWGCGAAPSDGGATPEPNGDDWPQWGRTPSKNMSSPLKNLPFAFDPGEVKRDGTVDMGTTRNVLWVAKLGSQTYGNPAVADGRVYVGTNNEDRSDPRFKGDYSRLHCIDAKTGTTLWTLTVPKMGTGKVGDWEFLGICAHPTVVENRVYLMTNRCEVMCLDVNGLADGNQGVQDEAHYMAFVGVTPGKPVELNPSDADIIWRYNMIEELGVFPHNITAGSPLVIGDIIYCNTSNGVTYDHTDIPSPKAPALIALDRKIAERPGATAAQILVGEENSRISRRIFHGAWTGPSWGEVGGKSLLVYGGPDGFLYAFDPKPVKDSDGYGLFPEKWRLDCNPPEYRWRNGDKGQPIKYASLREGPSEILATPVVYKDRVYVPIGQDPEHGARPGNLVCADLASGRKVWELRINSTMSTCSIVDDLLYVADWRGLTRREGGKLYCIGANDGKVLWSYDTASEVWSSPLVADGKVYLGNFDGRLSVFSTVGMKALADQLGAPLEVSAEKQRLVLRKEGKVVREIAGADVENLFHETEFAAAVHCSPVAANGVLYVATMRHLYAIKAGNP
jgi:outer membrane protein assembly factor BamB